MSTKAMKRGADQPAQQEPVAYIHRQGNHYEVSERFLSDDEKSRGWTEEPLYTSPPASKPWVGLTDEDVQELRETFGIDRRVTSAIEAKLREKNAAPRKPLTDEWQPAETGPQDGTPCLVYWGQSFGMPLIGVARRCYPYKGEMLWHGHGGSHNEVTHWMPLPAPPIEAAHGIK